MSDNPQSLAPASELVKLDTLARALTRRNPAAAAELGRLLLRYATRPRLVGGVGIVMRAREEGSCGVEMWVAK